MNKYTIGGVVLAVAAIVAGVIIYLQNFDPEKVSCDKIDSARAELQAAYDSGVSASVQVYAEEKAAIDERLSHCLSAKPADPCAQIQAARDAAVQAYNEISSPPDNSPYAEFQVYFKKRDDAYANYKKAKETLDACRAQNPPKAEVPYEQSDTKACFDAYDASVESIRATFEKNTQAMRFALKAAQASLDARQKVCNPPKGKEQFTDPPKTGESSDSTVPKEILNCRMLNAEFDSEILTLRKRAAEIAVEIQDVQKSIDNINKRMNPLERDLKEVDTYIPPQSAKTQFEGALNALRAERKVAIESALNFYKNLLTKKQAEKAALEKQLQDIEAQIAARLAYIEKENAARSKSFPTALHLAKPDKCGYYHCHGILCGRQDPAPDGCGHGSTSQADVDCKQFFNAYLKEAGVN